MSSRPPASLLTLPAELRLQIYGYLFADCLIGGYAKDVAGIYLCCRTVNGEIEHEFIKHARPALLAKSSWERKGFNDQSFDMTITRLQDPVSSQIHVVLPIKYEWMAEMEYLTVTPILKQIMKSLRPVTQGQWRTVSLSSPNISAHAFVSIADLLFRAVYIGFCVKSNKCARVTFDMDPENPIGTEDFLPFCMQMCCRLRNQFSNGKAREPVCCWITLTEPDTSLCCGIGFVLDFKSGLEAPKQPYTKFLRVEKQPTAYISLPGSGERIFPLP